MKLKPISPEQLTRWREMMGPSDEMLKVYRRVYDALCADFMNDLAEVVNQLRPEERGADASNPT